MHNLLKKKEEPHFGEVFSHPETNMNGYIKDIQEVFRRCGVDVPFYIAGGSLYSTLKGIANFDDIDVFFYNANDLAKMQTVVQHINYMYNKHNDADEFVLPIKGEAVHETENAYSVDSNIIKDLFNIHLPYKIQFIKRRVGSVEEVLRTFDLNCSMIAFTSCGKLIQRVDVNDPIEIKFENFKSNTMKRFKKYITSKNAQDTTNQYKKMITYLFDNFDVMLEGSTVSGAEVSMTGQQLLKQQMLDITHENAQFVHDLICEQHIGEDRIRIFDKISMTKIDIDMSDEYIAYMREIYNTYNNGQYAIVDTKYSHWALDKCSSDAVIHASFFDDKYSAKSKYPEYFI